MIPGGYPSPREVALGYALDRVLTVVGKTSECATCTGFANAILLNAGSDYTIARPVRQKAARHLLREHRSRSGARYLRGIRRLTTPRKATTCPPTPASASR